MNRIKFLICIAFASMALASCSKDDNPAGTVNLDDPQENVTDQPANSRGLAE